MLVLCVLFIGFVDHRDLHGLTHACPTRRSSVLQHLILLRERDEDRHAALGKEVTEKVRTAAKEGEAVGALGQSKPSVREMFEGVFKEPDWRVIEQRRELGV